MGIPSVIVAEIIYLYDKLIENGLNRDDAIRRVYSDINESYKSKSGKIIKESLIRKICLEK